MARVIGRNIRWKLVIGSIEENRYRYSIDTLAKESMVSIRVVRRLDEQPTILNKRKEYMPAEFIKRKTNVIQIKRYKLQFK